MGCKIDFTLIEQATEHMRECGPSLTTRMVGGCVDFNDESECIEFLDSDGTMIESVEY